MVNYQKAKIYKIYSKSNNHLVYYGCTTRKLSIRLSQHKGQYKRWLAGKRAYITSFKIFEECNDYVIKLVEKCPCDNKYEASTRERYYIENNECLNKCIPNRTAKEYRNDNRGKLSERAKEYRDNNRGKLSERAKEYYISNRGKILKRSKSYYIDNRDKILNYHKEYNKVHKDQKATYDKQYCDINKEKIKARKSEYYNNNKDTIKATRAIFYNNNKKDISNRCKIYYDSNKESIKKRSNAYYHANKKKVLETAQRKVVCECGRTVQRGNLSAHKRTKKHIKYIQSLQ
jgi:hypothetical protein